MRADLIAIIERWGATQGEQEERGKTGQCRPRTIDNARLIVIAKHIIGPGTGWEMRLERLDRLTNSMGIPCCAD